jgi:hypothetical protein
VVRRRICLPRRRSRRRHNGLTPARQQLARSTRPVTPGPLRPDSTGDTPGRRASPGLSRPQDRPAQGGPGRKYPGAAGRPRPAPPARPARSGRTWPEGG